MTLLEIHEPGETPLPHAGEGSLAVGIDLGTTNSVVAIARDGKPAALHDESGRAMVPSVVAYPASGGVLVGDEARLVMAQEPRNVVASVKRLMGRGAADLHAVAGVLPYEIEPGSGQTDMVKLRIGGKARSPVEISAEILKALRARAEAALEKPVERAVITVPAYFDDAARSKCCAWSMSRRRQHWPTAWTRAPRASTPSTIWAAGRSTSPCCGWRRACSRCWRPAATPRWAATISTAPSPNACWASATRTGSPIRSTRPP
jgi:Hsp70 protein